MLDRYTLVKFVSFLRTFFPTMEWRVSNLKLTGGRVYDPTNSIDGQIDDIWIRNGKIVEKNSFDESEDCLLYTSDAADE